MQAGDYGERRSEPWTYSRDEIPHQVFSKRALVKCGRGKYLRPKYRRAKNYFKISDVTRILSKLSPKESEEPTSWSQNIIRVLRDATLAMLDRILVFLPSSVIEDGYVWAIGLIDRVIGQEPLEDEKKKAARALIIQIAANFGLNVSFL